MAVWSSFCNRLLSLVITCPENEDGAANIIDSREGVTQGDPLSMVSSNIGVLPLIKQL